jgi:hypothetical protein
VINDEHTDAAFDEFMILLLPIIDKHAPVNLLRRAIPYPGA